MICVNCMCALRMSPPPPSPETADAIICWRRILIGVMNAPTRPCQSEGCVISWKGPSGTDVVIFIVNEKWMDREKATDHYGGNWEYKQIYTGRNQSNRRMTGANLLCSTLSDPCMLYIAYEFCNLQIKRMTNLVSTLLHFIFFLILQKLKAKRQQVRQNDVE